MITLSIADLKRIEAAIGECEECQTRESMALLITANSPAGQACKDRYANAPCSTCHGTGKRLVELTARLETQPESEYTFYRVNVDSMYAIFQNGDEEKYIPLPYPVGTHVVAKIVESKHARYEKRYRLHVVSVGDVKEPTAIEGDPPDWYQTALAYLEEVE